LREFDQLGGSSMHQGPHGRFFDKVKKAFKGES
jgi:molecular chaperone DnaJ